MNGIIKANTVDKYLRPIRHQIVELIEPNATVIEFGCGNGDLLFKLSGKISSGIGLDQSRQLITYAQNRCEKESLKNLSFSVVDVVTESIPMAKKDYSITSLLFHILSWEEAISLLKKQLTISKTTIVCGFSKPESLKQKMLLWFDQRFTKYYVNFKFYQKNGYTEGLLGIIGDIEYTCIDTFDPVIKIYKIGKQKNQINE